VRFHGEDSFHEQFIAASSDLMQSRFARLSARSESTSKAILTEHTVDAVSRIQILDDDHLVAGSRALTRGDDGPGEEEFPNLSNISGDYSTKE
jgi:hypothetical protein